MSFTIRLSQDLTAVEAGATVPLSIEVTNKGEEVDRFEMQVEGIDPEWTASPEPVFNVAPGETHSQKVFFKPPRVSESLAGNYPFVIRVRSLNTGDARTAQGVLQIKAFYHLSMEISPKKGYSSPVRQQNIFGATVTNLGNTEHTLQFSGADPEEECTFDFASDQVTVGPGQQKTVECTVDTARAGLFASSRLFGFTISARSIQNPNSMASANGQLERRPLLSPGTMLTALLILAVFLMWFWVRPQPPTIRVSVDSSTVPQGGSVHFHWKADHANSVRLEIRRSVDGKVQAPELEPDLQVEGTREIPVRRTDDTITITAVAVADNTTKSANPVTVSVQPPDQVPVPKALTFKANKDEIRYGEPILFTFSYSEDVVKLVLSPTNEQILPPLKRIQVNPREPGSIEYELFAYTKEGGAISRKLTVTAVKMSAARILQFSASPGTVLEPENRTTISWSVTNYSMLQLDDGTGSGLKTLDSATGSMDVLIDKPVTLKLIATDSEGVTITKKLPIKYKPLPPVVPPDTTSGGTTGDPPPTTGGTGGTTATTGGG